MDLDLLAALVFSFLMTLTIVVSIGGVILLRPLMKHLGEYLEAKAEEGRLLAGRNPAEWDRIMAVLERVEGRMELLEEKQEFTEKLLRNPLDHESQG